MKGEGKGILKGWGWWKERGCEWDGQGERGRARECGKGEKGRGNGREMGVKEGGEGFRGGKRQRRGLGKVKGRGKKR